MKIRRKKDRPAKERIARVPQFASVLNFKLANADCTVDNLVHTLEKRVYIATPRWDPPPELWKVGMTAATRMGRRLGAPLTPEELDEVFQGFPVRKRNLYKSELEKPFDPKKSRCTGFLKDEWTKLKENWKSRVIQFRDPHYLAHLMRLYRPIEKLIYKCKYAFNKCQKYTCAKGLNFLERMSYLEELVSELKDPYVVDIDGSAFDAHVVEKALKFEWACYGKAAKTAGWSRFDVDQLKQFGLRQLVNKVKARCVDGFVSWTVRGNRMSGDLNTGAGNSLLQMSFIAAAMAMLRIPEECWRMLVDGDDAVLLVEGAYRHLLDQLPGIFRRFAQEVKIGSVKKVTLDSMEVIDFCQCRPVRVNGKWRLIRAPIKAVSGYLHSFKWSKTDELYKSFLATISPPEMIANMDVPILDKFYRVCHTIGGSAKPLEEVANNFWRRQILGCGAPPAEARGVSMETRVSFERAFGIDPPTQMWMEDCIDTHRGKEQYFQ